MFVKYKIDLFVFSDESWRECVCALIELEYDIQIVKD